jgi:hypothetical protein
MPKAAAIGTMPTASKTTVPRRRREHPAVLGQHSGRGHKSKLTPPLASPPVPHRPAPRRRRVVDRQVPHRAAPRPASARPVTVQRSPGGGTTVPAASEAVRETTLNATGHAPGAGAKEGSHSLQTSPDNLRLTSGICRGERLFARLPGPARTPCPCLGVKGRRCHRAKGRCGPCKAL